MTADVLRSTLQEFLLVCVGVQLVEVADTQSKICIHKQLCCLSFCGSHEQHWDVGLNCSLLEK